MSKHILPQAGTFEIAPSILSADFANLASEIAQMTDLGIRVIHLDVMDGHFVPNITMGPPVVKWIRKCTDAVLDTHLMITDPEKYAPEFIKAGSDHITFHIETVKNPADFIKALRDQGVTIGVTLNPETDVATIEKVASLCDMVLVMTVHPGFGGQSFIDEAARKCIRVRDIVGPDVRIEVDGGIDPDTIATVRDYGADTFVAGNAIFGQENRREAVAQLQAALRS
jgi:ribulose-phosphate 3-epimerase